MRAERLTDSLCYHGEGPVWWPTEAIRWVDMLAGDVLTMDTDGEITRTHVGTIAACLRPRAGGGAIIAVERGLVTTERDDLGELQSHPDVITDPGLRFNEGGCDPDGRFWCGSMAYDQAEGAATLYRVTADLVAEVVLPHVTISNGLDWSPDGRTGYHTDTATGTISCFDRDDHGGMTDRRTFVDCGDGSPDGLTVDADGNVWTALNGDGVVHCYSPTGTLEQVVEVGARQVTACTFGGPDLRTLYVTTSRENLPAGDDPQAGSLFAVRPGATGRPPQVWRP
ncbi:SMP-30/gluconolactonase/LRE family protein [Arsenicicoccus dermatophilus]|uniref:SMP-30/gluconolactonase/LRE family protein n=1 Tax=Arsenicicoccus dermatophilus TaxID=1076331 RepID=UPI001F4CFB7C|nr:SMP-30/gluconolactonase/LRE family protein [Arsenicicoccus dermatophilus]MCH8614003.1 SMP-30/gluconolactonase/LRE family protein [Arsenicicoccus dermatophilus]